MVGRRGIAGLFIAALAAIAAGSTAAAGPVATKSSFPVAQNGHIVFGSTRDTGGNDIDVFIANADGSGATNLTPGNPGVDSYEPSVSPDGRKILFGRDPGDSTTTSAHVFVMNADGSNPVDLTPGNTASQINDDGAVFSPDGKKIAFDSRRADGDGDIFVMNADGSNPVNLTPASTQTDVGPEWSPDGSHIYFGRDIDPGGAYNGHVFVMNADGSNQLDLGPGDGPALSPDGTRLVFGRDVGFHEHLFAANPDGSGATDLTPTSTTNSFDPVYSPDGKTILFVSDVDPGAPIVYELLSMNADGSGVTQVTHSGTGLDSFDPAWEYVYMCKGRRATIVGTNASEKLKGTKKADVIVGLDGKDKIYGRGGNDRLCGGAGKDILVGGKGKDKLSGGPGKDKQKQ